jgi:hypothetical protein
MKPKGRGRDWVDWVDEGRVSTSSLQTGTISDVEKKETRAEEMNLEIWGFS